MKKKQLREKRRYLRLVIKNKIGVQNKAKKQNKRVCAQVKNFSAEGLCFESRDKFKPGSKVGVELNFPAYIHRYDNP